ncbi:MAG TPA: DUF6750 family protein [Burkholderiaceae bacterium]|nr:DUF6750 family protein [Burkholderiaceae bacterium]
MSKVSLNPIEWLADAGRHLYVKATVRAGQLANRQWEHPWQGQLMRATAGVTLLGLVAKSAHADGVADMVTKAADQGDVIKTNAGRLFAAGGFGGAGYGGYHWWRKGKEGEHSQIKAGQIVWPIVGGAVLGATGYVLIKAGETVGIAGSSQGQIPN